MLRVRTIEVFVWQGQNGCFSVDDTNGLWSAVNFIYQDELVCSLYKLWNDVFRIENPYRSLNHQDAING